MITIEYIRECVDSFAREDMEVPNPIYCSFNDFHELLLDSLWYPNAYYGKSCGMRKLMITTHCGTHELVPSRDVPDGLCSIDRRVWLDAMARRILLGDDS